MLWEVRVWKTSDWESWGSARRWLLRWALQYGLYSNLWKWERGHSRQGKWLEKQKRKLDFGGYPPGARVLHVLWSLNSYKNPVEWYCCLSHNHLKLQMSELNSSLLSASSRSSSLVSCVSVAVNNITIHSVAQAWVFLMIFASSHSAPQHHPALLIPTSKHRWSAPTLLVPGCLGSGPGHTIFHALLQPPSASWPCCSWSHPPTHSHPIHSPHSSQRDPWRIQTGSHSSS